MDQNGNERSFKDPVCGMEVCRTTAVAEFTYYGKTYYFCAGACRESFMAEPETYIKHHRQHGMKPRRG